MRETRLSGSEGGGARTRSPYPYPIEPRLLALAPSDGEQRCLSCKGEVGVFEDMVYQNNSRGGRDGARLCPKDQPQQDRM